MLNKILTDKAFTAKAVFGFFPANSIGDDIEVMNNDNATMIHTLRQQVKKRKGQQNMALADFIAPKDSSRQDYIGSFAVTIHGAEELAKGFEADFDDYNSIMVKALADRLAEAFAEHLHELVRKTHWGYAPEESFSNAELIKESYRGIRPAPGYPACPDHTEKGIIWDLLDVEAKIGMTLTESYAMYPAASVSGLYFAHPESRYFAVGKMTLDQISDYAQRKGIDVIEAEKWLAPYLAYEPKVEKEFVSA